MSEKIMLDNQVIFTIKDAELQRLDKWLFDRFYDKSKSRSYFQYLIENGYVLVNNKKVKKRIVPKIGDEICLTFAKLPEPSLKAENIPLDILFEDEHIIAINKPTNMVVHPALGNWSKTFVNALLYHCKNLDFEKDDIRAGIVHRLDKDTTGVLLAAKTIKSQQVLLDMFANREMKKEYLAICLNKTQNQTINAPIGRHPKKRKEMIVKDGGREAITEIEILKSFEGLSLILAKPKTGRTHQIRVHLKQINSPILGDPVYGSESINKKYNLQKPFLHAKSLEFIHPITKKNMLIEAPLPEEFQKFLEKIL